MAKNSQRDGSGPVMVLMVLNVNFGVSFLLKKGLDKDSACVLIRDFLCSMAKNATAYSIDKCIESL